MSTITHIRPLFSFPYKNFGVTLIELLCTVSILGVLVGIAVPNYSAFITQMRVDNEISQLYRLLFITRNAAINTRQTTTLCHLDNNAKCDSQWQQELSVFIDINGNKIYEPNLNERIISTKSAINTNDKLIYGKGRNGVLFSPTGRLAGWGSNGTFRYCPQNNNQYNRGIRVATSGRLYISTDIDNDDKDEDRNGKELSCL